eukprot:COSAG05_NODE_2444_length_3058_cov_13.939500_3_plen_162_part_00
MLSVCSWLPRGPKICGRNPSSSPQRHLVTPRPCRNGQQLPTKHICISVSRRPLLWCKSTRETVQLYNLRTKRIFPVRCGGFDHEYHSFWATFKREHAAEAARKGTLGTDTLLRNDKPNNEASTVDGDSGPTISKSPSSITFIFDTPSGYAKNEKWEGESMN